MENEDPVPRTSEVEKKLRITYSRNFLLSLGELDVCKKLPNGFNESILSEFGGLSTGNYDRQRNVGSFRGEYASHSHKGLEGSSNIVRGNQSRWETRSTGSSDKDVDSQSDRDSVSQDPGRRFGNQTRRWQNPKIAEHDGLLGSGVFPRPAGFTAPRYHGNGSYQLNKTTEPYQPPRPYKAVPYSRKDHTDSCNDETFGSAECSSENRVEEEKIRRANFELMRKEQQKIHQDKQKQSGINRKTNIDSDMAALLGNPLDEKPQTDSSTSTSNIHAAAPRPLVPPGFSSALAEKNLPVQSSSVPLPSEAGNAAFGDKISKAFSQLSTHATGKLMAPLSTEILEQKVDQGNIFGKEAAEEANELWEDDIVIMNDSSCKNDKKFDVKDIGDLDHSTTVIEKLFSSALSKRVPGSAYGLEHQIVKAEKEILGPAIIESTKFSQRYSYKEKKPEGEHSSKELFSLIVNKEKDTDDIFDSFITPQILPTPAPSFLVDVVSEQYSQSDNKNKIASSSVLTCEDLEQSILAEVKETDQNVHHYDANFEKKEIIDDSASNHLLSLLHKGTVLQGSSESSPTQDTSESLNRSMESHANPSSINSSEQTLTLESLFGASFMNALHSAEAPVSARTGVNGNVVNIMDTQEGQALEFQLPEEDSLISVGDSVTPLENAHNTYGLLSQNGNIEDQNSLFNAIFGDGAHAPEGSTHIQKGPLEMIDPNEKYHHVHGPGSQFPGHIDQTRSIFLNSHFDNLANRNPQMKFAYPGGMHHEHLFHGNHAQQQNVFGKNGGDRFDPVASHHLMLQQHMQISEKFPPHQAMRGYTRGVQMPGYAPEMNNARNFPLQSVTLPGYGAYGTRLPAGHVGGSHPEALERLFEMEMQARKKTNQQMNHGYPDMNLPENMNIRYR